MVHGMVQVLMVHDKDKVLVMMVHGMGQVLMIYSKVMAIHEVILILDLYYMEYIEEKSVWDLSKGMVVHSLEL